MPKKEHHRPPCGADMPVTMLVNELSRLFHNEMRLESSAIGMKNGYRHLLFHLAREENLSQLELTGRTHLKAPTVSVTLAKMEAEGLVTRATDPNDARTMRISLTEAGRALDRTLQERIAEKERTFTEVLSEEEAAYLKQLLLRIRGHLLFVGWGEDGRPADAGKPEE